MNIILDKRYFWALRAICYKLIFGKIGNMSYIGHPLFIVRAKRVFLGKRVRIFPHFRFEILNDMGSINIQNNVSIGQNFHAISDGELTIGENTTISANVFITNTEHTFNQVDVHIMDQPMKFSETQVGSNCFIGYGVTIQAGTILGKQCIIGANAVVRGQFPDYCVIVGAPAKIVKRYNPENQQWEKTNNKGDLLR